MKDLLLIIPCYNEENRFRLKEIKTFVEQHDRIDFCFVNDGSTDGTVACIKKHFLNHENCFLISFVENSGKGNAIRKAFLYKEQADYRYYGFIDADLEIPFSQVLLLLEEIKKGNFLMVISSRNLRKNLKLRRYRSILSFVMMKVANTLIGFDTDLPDTQCGNKIFRKEILKICFEEKFLSEWLFDIEVFLRFKKKYPEGRNLIQSVPLVALDKSIGKSSFRILQNLKLAKQLLNICVHYK